MDNMNIGIHALDSDAVTVTTGQLGHHSAITASIRVERLNPHAFRMAEYPDGRKIIQGAYKWEEGFMIGETWRDLECVKVDESGKLIV